MSYNLSQLGWKAFQDLACTVTAEVLQRPVQTFLGSNDGGRDGAFLGTWNDPDGTTAKSTIQCKFFGKPDATLTLSKLNTELPKAAKLAAQGLADDYIIFTNAGVSGDSDQEICAAFRGVGVPRCRVFGGSWIVQQLMERPRLRMLVPRVYGIGDLSHIITGHGCKQAKAILDSMGSDLSCFVPTDAYRRALTALHKHHFVILLGAPASGKSTIAAILALGALDEGCLGALKINAPDQLTLWHPGEKQFLWVDDAFGPNQFDSARMSRWNAELDALCQQRKSAVRMQRAAAGPSNRNKPFRVDVRDSLEGTDSPGRLRRSRSKRSLGIFRIEKMSEKGFAGSSPSGSGGLILRSNGSRAIRGQG